MAPGFQKSKAALARAARLKVVAVSSSDPDSSDSDNCHWDGTEVDKVPQLFETFNHHNIVYDGSEMEWRCEDGPLPSDDQSDESDQDLEGLGLLRSFALAGNDDEASIATAYQAITEYKSEKNWKEAEKKLKGPYTGNSERSQQRNDKKLRDKEEEDKISRMRYVFIKHSSFSNSDSVSKCGRHFFQKHVCCLASNSPIESLCCSGDSCCSSDNTTGHHSPRSFHCDPSQCVCHLSSCR
jgi:hypothetical protein